jgi:putative flavoprotein involved in K+ transport
LRRSEFGSGYTAKTTQGAIQARNIVVATGPYQRPAVPNLLAGNGDIFQVHASKYKAPDQLPKGGVLIVGSGASGTQIAEELHRANRKVYLSVGKHRRMPRRYRGHDLIGWLVELGLDKTPVEKRGPDKTLPLITGAYGGHTIDFRELASQGITLLGRVLSERDGKIDLAPGLRDSLDAGDTAYFEFLDKVDCHVRSLNLDVPPEPDARKVLPYPACVTKPVRQLDLKQEGINSVIWATGYKFDFSWIKLPVLDSAGEPEHRGGITESPGLYFIGLPWLTRMNSSFLSGVGDDAATIATHIAQRMSRLTRDSVRYAHRRQ